MKSRKFVKFNLRHSVIRLVRVLGFERAAAFFYFNYRYVFFLIHLRVIQYQRIPLKVIIGSSGTSQNGWIKTELHWLDISRREDWIRHFRLNSIDALLAEHVFEHIAEDSLTPAIDLIHSFLRPGGYIRVAVPDGNHPDASYILQVKPGGTGEGAFDHKVLFDHQSLSEMFTRAGFVVNLLEYFDTDFNFHYQNWSTSGGYVERSLNFDSRNFKNQPNYTSVILDAIKPLS
jgi:predicted SAM-dependent methyltransferase